MLESSAETVIRRVSVGQEYGESGAKEPRAHACEEKRGAQAELGDFVPVSVWNAANESAQSEASEFVAHSTG
jgi:hypothetical protein